MKQSGQIVLTPFPYTNLASSKLRPVLLLKKASDYHDDWLVCMLTSQLHQYDSELDEMLTESDDDFLATGLKVPSVIRLSRLAVLSSDLMIGCIGQINIQRLTSIKNRLCDWILISETAG